MEKVVVTNGQQTYELTDPIQISAFVNSGYEIVPEEVESKKKGK